VTITLVIVSAGAVTDTVAESDFVVSATEVAVTITVVFVATVGAVNSPVEVIVPALVVQVTDVVEALVTVAVNC